MNEAKPHPSNVPGDFFVEDGCCLTCEVPFGDAPGLFAWAYSPDGHPHCYVRKQPDTAEEREQMFAAIRHAEAGCIKYRGCDRAIQERLVEGGEGPICLNLPLELQHRSDEVQAAQKQHRPGIRGKLLDLLMRTRRGDPA
jgi:hypothetical protein